MKSASCSMYSRVRFEYSKSTATPPSGFDWFADPGRSYSITRRRFPQAEVTHQRYDKLAETPRLAAIWRAPAFVVPSGDAGWGGSGLRSDAPRGSSGMQTSLI